MRVLIAGAGGQIGTELARALRERQHDVTALGREDLDITRVDDVLAAAHAVQPSVFVNAAAFTAVDKAEDESGSAFLVNAEGAGHIADAAHATGAAVVHFSTDYVFDGAQTEPYGETAPTNPLNVYGRSKLAGETLVRRRAARHLVIRTSWVFAAHGRNFVRTMLSAMARGQPLDVVDDQHGCPTNAAGLAGCIADMLPKTQHADFRGWGTYHLCGAPATTWFRFANEIARALPSPSPFRVPEIRPVASADRRSRAVRPRYSVLDNSAVQQTFGVTPPDWRTALREVVKALL